MRELDFCGEWFVYWRLPKSFIRTVFTLLLLCFVKISVGQVSADFSASVTQGCSPLVVCFTNTSTGNPTSYLWDFGNGNQSPDKNPCAIYIVPGTYTVKLTVSKSGSSDTKTVTNLITVFQNPVADFSASDTVGCPPKTISFTDLSAPGDAAIIEWDWDFGDGQTSHQQNPIITYTNPGVYTVVLVVRDANGCTNQYSANNLIRILPGPVADFEAVPNFSCTYPADITFNNLTTGGSGLTYEWDFGDSQTSTQKNPTHTYSSPGSYTVELTANGVAGCSHTVTKADYLVIGALAPDFTANPTSGCGNVNVNFTDITAPGANITDYFWDFGDGSTSNVQNTFHNYTNPGTYTVKFAITSDQGCTDTVIYNNLITVNTEPEADFTADNTQGCVTPFTVNFTDNSTNAVSWDWDFGDGNVSTQQNPSHDYVSHGSYGVRLTVTSADGCTDSKFIANYIDVAAPNVNFSADITEGCIDLTVNFSDWSTSIEPLTDWLWDFGDGNTSTQKNPSHTYTSQGEYDVSLTITNSAGCSDDLIKSAFIAAGDTPVANFGAGALSACLFDAIDFYDSSNVGDDWYWDFGDGGTSTQQNPTHQFSDTGSFDVTLIVYNFGCSDTFIRPDYISISPPQALFNITYNCTNPYEVVLSDNSLGPNLWSWSFGDGDTSTIKDNTHTFDTTGTFPVRLLVQDTSSGCFDSIVQNVNITDPVADFSGTPLSGCAPLIVNFTSNSIDANDYLWDFGNGDTSTQQDPIYTYNDQGVYDVTLFITDIHGCSDTIIKNNYVTTLGIEPNFAADTLFGCTPLTVNYVDSSSSFLGAINSWFWQFGDGDTSSLQNPTKVYTVPGLYSVTLAVTDTNGCNDSLTKVNYIVPTYPAPDFEASDTIVCVGQDVTFNNLSVGTGMSYFWDFGDGESSSQETPVHAYSNPGLYTVSLTATDINGCDSTLVKPLYIEVLQPNGDLFADSLTSSCPPLWVNFDDMTPASDSITAWLWHFGDGQTSDLQYPSHVYTTPDTFWAHLEVTNNIGCKDTAYLPDPIIVSGPRGTFDFIQDEYCIPAPVRFFSDAADTIIHVYDFADGNVGVYIGGDTITYNYTYADTFFPSLILDDGHGCIISIDHPDSIITFTDTADFTSDIKYICKSSIVQFFDLSTGIPPVISWHWDFGDGDTSTQKNPTHYYGVPGSYDVTLIITNDQGCTDTIIKPKFITVDPGPVADFAFSDSNVCIPEIIEFTDMSVSDSLIVSWSWDFGDGDTSVLQNPFHTYTTVDTFDITLMIETIAGCRDTVIKSIITHGPPIAEAGPDTSICYGDTAQLHGSGGLTYAWSPGATLNDPNIPNPMAFPLNTTTYHLTVTDSNGCTDTDFATINIYPLPIVGATNGSMCYGELYHLSASGGVSYQWSPDSTLNNPNIANPWASPLVTTNYMVTVTDSYGCVNTTNTNVIVHPLPTPTVTAASTVLCNGQSAQLNATGGVTYIWSPSTGLNNANIPNPVANPFSSKTYVVTVIDSNGCTNEDSIDITIFPMPSYNISPDADICINDSVQLSVTTVTSSTFNWYPATGLSCTTCSDPFASPVTTTKYYVDITNSYGCITTDSITVTVEPLPVITITNSNEICNGESYQLNASGGASYSWSPDSSLSCSTCADPVATPSTTTTYTVAVTSAFGCVNYDSVTIEVNRYSSLMAISDSIACIPATIQFTDLSTADGSIISRNWNFSDGSTDTVSNPSRTYTTPGVYDVQLIILTSNGCTDSITQQITINGLPIADAGPDVTICTGDSTQLNASGGIKYEWSNGSYLSNDSIANPFAFPTTTTTYGLTVTDINGCTDTDSAQVKVNPLPTVTISSDKSTCATTPVQLNASGGSSYHWSPPNNLSDPFIPNPTALPFVSTTYTVVVTDSNGCENTGSVSVTIHPLPIVSVSGDTTMCYGGSAELHATGGDTYVWTPDSSLSCNNCEDPIATPVETTIYEVRIINQFGCEVIKQVTVVVEPLPALTITKDTFMCSGDSIQLNATGGDQYSWSPIAGLSDPTISNPIAFPFANTTYVLEATTNFGCIDYDTVDVEVIQFNSKMALSDTTGCIPMTIQFTDQSYSSDTIATWTWDFDNGIIDSVQHPQHGFTVPGTYNVSLAIQTQRGCVDTVYQPIVVHGLPSADAGPDTTLCFGESARLNGSGGGSYDWAPMLGLNNNTIPNPLAQPNVTRWYELMVTDSNGCKDWDSVLVTVNPLPDLNITHDTELCFTDSLQLNATGGVTYNWTPTIGLNNPNIADPKASPPSSTTYTVVVNNEFNCIATDSVTVVIKPVPDIQIKAKGQICQGEITDFDVTGAQSYSWSPSSSLTCDDCPNPSAYPDTTTFYILTMTDAHDCTWVDTLPLYVRPLPEVETRENKVICKGEEIELTTVASGATTYEWNPAATLNYPDILSPIARPVATTTYKIKVANRYGCSAYDTVTISVIDQVHSVAIDDQEICLGESILLESQITQTGSNGTYVIWLPAEEFNKPTAFHQVISPEGNATYTMIAYSGTCTPDTQTINVIVNPLPTVDAGEDQEVLAGSNITLTATSPDFIQFYSWSPTEGLGCAECPTTNLTAEESETYVVEVTDQNGCPAKDSVRIRVITDCSGELWVPNVFTPNGDEVNDIFRPRVTELLELLYFKVFDRWGNLVYKTDDKNEGWNGVFNGSMVNPDVYVYDAKAVCENGLVVSKKGNVTVIR